MAASLLAMVLTGLLYCMMTLVKVCSTDTVSSFLSFSSYDSSYTQCG